MGFGSSIYKNSQSEDPYAFEIDDTDDCLTRPKRQHKSVIKQNKIFKNCNSQSSVVICRPQEGHLSQDFSPQINRQTIYKHKNRIRVSEKQYRFFKSRNTLLSGENLKSGINSKYVSQDYSNAEYSPETHCLSDTGNEDEKKCFTTQDPALFLSNSFIKQNKTNSLTSTRAIASPEEENLSSSTLRTFPGTSVEEAVPALSENHTLNLRSIKKLNCQNSSQIIKPFMFQKYKKVLHKQQQEALTKPKKFFKIRDRNAISNCNLGYGIRNSCEFQDKDSFNTEKHIPYNMKPVSKDPYLIETEDDSYSMKQDEELKYSNTKNICIYQNRNRPSTETVNKNSKCMPNQKDIKSSDDQLSTETEHVCIMQCGDATKPKLLHSPGKQNVVSSNKRAVNQPSVGKITNQSKQENYFPMLNTRVNSTFQPTNDSDDILSLPKSSEIGSNLFDKRGHQGEISHLSSSMMYVEENRKSQITATSSKKCSIAYTYVIKNGLSAVTLKRNSPKNTNAESIPEENKQIYDTHLTSGNINCKKDNISRETRKLANETKSKVSPVIKNLAKLNSHSNITEKNHARATNATDNNEESNLMPSNYMVCNKTMKPSLETKEFYTPETNSTHVDVNDVKSLKQTQSSSSCISFTKNIDTDIEISCTENDQNHLITDQLVSESATNETENYFKPANDSQLSCSSQRKLSQEMLRNTFTDGIEIAKNRQNTTVFSHEKYKMGYHMETKDNTERENLIKLQVPTKIKTTEKESESEIERSAQQNMYAVNKTFLPIKKRDSSFKKRIFTSDQRNKSELVYRHKWVDDNEGDKDKLMSPNGLLVQPVSIINSEPELDELQLPLLCVASKHIQSNKFSNKAEAEGNEMDKKYFTVIKNVKNPDEIQELGELQQFNDDVEYILDALQDSNPIATRCHSALILASKCLTPEFIMHMTAYDTMTKLSSALHDAAEDQSLALCAATIMFILSQYQVITYMSSSSIHLLLSLFQSCLKYEAESVMMQSIKKKVLELYSTVQSQGFVTDLLHENITASHLASEVLLKLTSCDKKYLFEDRLREMGGLKHIIMAIINCRTEIDGFFVQWRGDLIDKLRFLNCCLKILECVTEGDEENQLYVLKYESSCFMGTMAALFTKCIGEIRNVHQFNDTSSKVTLEVLFTILMVLINLTHSNNNTSFGSSLVAKRPEIIHAGLYVLFQAPNYVPEEKKFDLLALVLMFLINTVNHNTCNRKLIIEATASDIMVRNSNNEHTVKLLIELFYQQEKLARIEEFKTNAMLDDQIESELSPKPLAPSQEFISTLQEKAGQNMEHTMIASYIVLLIGYLIVDNEEYEIYVRQRLPQRSFSTMISVLEKMHNFLNMVPTISSKKDITQTQHIIQCLKQADDKATVATSNTYQL